MSERPEGEWTVKRSEGPTPAGGTYSEAFIAEDGSIVEIVEYDADGRALQRTYGANLIDDARTEVEAMEAAIRERFGPEHRLLRPGRAAFGGVRLFLVSQVVSLESGHPAADRV